MNLSEGTTLQGGKYRIEKCLGQGGFGITYLAEWKQRKAKVAIKEFFIQELCYRDEQSSQITVLSEGGRRTVEHFRKKFLREAETIFNLNHPNIIRIYDVFEENGTAYYVMEYHSNGSLADKLKKMNGAPLPEADALRYTKQVADALAYIHEQKMPIIENEEVKKRSLRHLDIKPGNIMINERGEAVLIDFGLVKVYDEEGKPLSTTSSTLNGFSPGFAPLEQMQGSSSSIFTPATDIYALGATLYNLIEGRVPPLAGDVLKMKGNLPFSDTTSEPIRKAITEAMRPIDEDRPQSIAEFLKLLPQKDTDLNVVYKKRLEEGIALFQAGEYAKALSHFFELENLFPEHKAEIEEWMNKFLELMSDSDSGEGKTVQRKPVPPKPVSPTPPKPTPTPTPWRKIGGGALLLALLVVLCFIFRPGSCKGKGENEETPDSILSSILSDVNSRDSIRIMIKDQEVKFKEVVLDISQQKNNSSITVDTTTNLQTLQQRAELGEVKAQKELGYYYFYGKGLDKTPNYPEAVRWYRKAAEQGDAEAQNYLGYCYKYELGVSKDYVEAVRWYQKAAEQGLVNAQCNLGNCYFNGQGVSKDYVEAVRWYRKAAEQGFASAQNNLGYCYQHGQGVSKDYDEAVRWYQKAAEQGLASAQNNLGYCYRHGQGVSKDYDEAVRWYQKAAEQGFADALYNLGICYEYGYGVPKNKKEAHSYYRKAADKGYQLAKEKLEQ